MRNLGTKRCPKCDEIKNISEFYKDKKRKDGLNIYCIVCIKEYRKNNQDNLIKTRKKYYSKYRNQIIEKSKQYAQENRVTVLKRQREYYHNNIEKFKKYNDEHKEYRQQYYIENKEAYSIRRKEWSKKNSDKLKTKSRNRRALKRNAIGAHTLTDIKQQYETQEGLCYWCNTPVGDTYHVDHVIPLSRGGTNLPDNLVISCPYCNLSKGSKLPEEWKMKMEGYE